MLVTESKKNDCRIDNNGLLSDFMKCDINKGLAGLNVRKENLNGYRCTFILSSDHGKYNLNQNRIVNIEVPLVDYCRPFLNESDDVSDEDVDRKTVFHEDCVNKKNNSGVLLRKISVNSRRDYDKENRRNDMNSEINKMSDMLKIRSCPTRFSPTQNWNSSDTDLSVFNHYSPAAATVAFDNDSNNENGCIDADSIHSGFERPTTSKNSPEELKLLVSDDEDESHDFDFNLGERSDVPECVDLFNEKNELNFGSDLVCNNKYDNNEILVPEEDDICWGDQNYEGDIDPLKGYEVENPWGFCQETLDGESEQRNYSQAWNCDESNDDAYQALVCSDPQLITPRKTVDITKIKGWRKKQFTQIKSGTNFNGYSDAAGSEKSASNSTRADCLANLQVRSKTDTNSDYAFVCDRLDDFLDQEAELKINYEIPHLDAEFGIKLTSEDLVSRPKVKEDEGKLILNSKRGFRQKPKSSIKTEIEAEVNDSAFTKRVNREIKQVHNLKLNKKRVIVRPPIVQKDPIVVKEVNAISTSGVPCRRSSRLLQNLYSNKVVVPEKSTERFLPRIIRRVERPVRCSVSNKPKPVHVEPTPSFLLNPSLDLRMRTFGMVIYPGPFVKLNPFVQNHLNKIRSYQTLIDKKWATFAVSAVHTKNKANGKRKRMILPLTCCFNCSDKPESSSDFKIEVDPEVQVLMDNMVDEVCRSEEGALWIDATDQEFPDLIVDDVATTEEEDPLKLTKSDYERFKNSQNMNGVNTFRLDNCSQDRSLVPENRSDVIIDPEILEGDKDEPDIIELNGKDNSEYNDFCRKFSALASNVRLSTRLNQMTFNKIVTRLLSRKINELKSGQNTTNSIDNLKTVRPNVLELIKLNFIKENFLSGYVNIWYVKCEGKPSSRAFLTFSMNPPVHGAINLKMVSRLSVKELPKIITDIISRDRSFDPNDFAILFCDGNQWEIHGSINFTMDKNKESGSKGDEKIQVFHLTRQILPELQSLQEIKHKNEKNQVLKWWIMNMMQDFTEIVIRFGDEIGKISRSRIHQSSKLKVSTFLPFTGIYNSRPIGISINSRFWPYFLIGPYYVGEKHGLSLVLKTKTVPFEYSLPLDRIKPNFLLKRFISSVIMHSWRNCKQVVGMWLYDRTVSKRSSFIEVRTKFKKTGNYEPIAEHDYSLSQTRDGLFEGNLEDVQAQFKRKELKVSETAQTPQEVYLVPNIQNLGYVKGELQPDLSIIIDHPLKPDRKIRSHRIGEWLTKVLRRRIRFIPSNLELKWSVVKDPSILGKPLKPLNKLSLAGTQSVGEIEKLEKEELALRKVRRFTERERELLCLRYIKALEDCAIDESIKKTMNFYIRRISQSRKGRSSDEKIRSRSLERLEAIVKFLRKSFKFPKLDFRDTDYNNDDVIEIVSDDSDTDKPNPVSTEGNKETVQTPKTVPECEKPKNEPDVVNKLETKIKHLRELLDKNNAENSSVHQKLTERLNSLSEHLERIKNSFNCERDNQRGIHQEVSGSSPETSDKEKDEITVLGMYDAVRDVGDNERNDSETDDLSGTAKKNTTCLPSVNNINTGKALQNSPLKKTSIRSTISILKKQYRRESSSDGNLNSPEESETKVKSKYSDKKSESNSECEGSTRKSSAVSLDPSYKLPANFKVRLPGKQLEEVADSSSIKNQEKQVRDLDAKSEIDRMNSIRGRELKDMVRSEPELKRNQSEELKSSDDKKEVEMSSGKRSSGDVTEFDNPDGVRNGKRIIVIKKRKNSDERQIDFLKKAKTS